MIKKFSILVFGAGLFFSPSANAAENLKINLDDAVKLALENNRAIEQYEEDRESARWGLSAARRSAGPRLSWSSSFNRIGGRYYNNMRAQRYEWEGLNPVTKKYYEQYRGYSIKMFPKYLAENSNSLSLSMPIYTGGRLEGQRNSAKYGLNSADLNLENARQQIKWQTAQAYYRVLQYKDLMNVRQEEITNLNEHLRTVQIQYEVGTVAMSDYLATNVQLANSKQALNTARGNYETAIANLNDIMGLPTDTNLLIEENLKYKPYEKNEDECVEYAIEHRPDGKSAAYAVKRAEANVDYSKSGYRPNVSAVVQGSIYGEGAFKADHSNGQERWSAGLQLSWDIFDNNVTAAQVQQAKSAQRKAESVARQQLDTIRLEVHTAYTNLKISEENIKITSAALKQAEEQYLIYKVRYEEGVDTNYVVMNAQEKLTQARTNYFSALYSYNTSKAQLEKAMGVPIGIDAAIYSVAVDNGKNATAALKESAITPLRIFDENGKIKKRDIDSIRADIDATNIVEENISTPFGS